MGETCAAPARTIDENDRQGRGTMEGTTGLEETRGEGMRAWATHAGTLTGIGLVLAGTLVYRVLGAAEFDFNAQRLLPSFMLVRGMSIFPRPHEGPLLSTMYGPVTTATYLPVTLTHDPVTGILAGAALTAVLCFGAMLWLHLRQTPGRVRTAVLAFLATGLLACILRPTLYSCLSIHADGPALFYGMLAVGMTSLRGRWERAGLPLAAFCAALSVWSKQPLVGVAAGIALYYGITQGLRAMLRFSAYAAGAMVALGMLFSSVWTWKAIAFNLLDVPAHHPWKHPSKPLELVYSYRTFVATDLVVLAPLLACLWMWSARGEGELLRRMRGQLWACALLVGLCLVPLSLISFSKVGGDVNNLSFATLFLLLALMLLLQAMAAGDGAEGRAAEALLLSAAVLCASLEAPLLTGIGRAAKGLRTTNQAVAFAYMQAHPGAGYFPWFPLAQLESDGRVYNGMYGLWNHVAGGVAPTDAEFRAQVPAGMQFVGFSAKNGPWVSGLNFLTYLPEYACATSDPELPGFTLYVTRANAAARGIACDDRTPVDPEALEEAGTQG